jgi:hypothetical protein
MLKKVRAFAGEGVPDFVIGASFAGIFYSFC